MKTLPWSKSVVQQEYHRKIKKAAMKFWSCLPRFDQMALIDPDFSHNKFTKLTHSISCNQASILFQLQSGHIPLNMYLHRINKADSPICQGCQHYKELVFHYIMRCKTYTVVRQAMFNAAGRDARKLGKLLSTVELIPHLFQFIKTMERLRLSHERTTEA